MKNNPLSLIRNYLVGVREEIKKVTWPTRTQTIQTTVLVIVATLAIAAYVGVIDYGLSLLIKRFLIK